MQLKTYKIAKCDSFDYQACSLLQVINVMTNLIIMIIILINCAEILLVQAIFFKLPYNSGSKSPWRKRSFSLTYNLDIKSYNW